MIRSAACALVIAIGLYASPATAQCVASGTTSIPSATLGPETLRNVVFRGLDVTWPPAADGTFVAQVHTPIEATFAAQCVPLTLVYSPFFSENVPLEFARGRPVVHQLHFRVTGLRPGCEDVRLGHRQSFADARPAAPSSREVNIGSGLVLHAEPDSPVTARLTSTRRDATILVVERRDGWTRVEEEGVRGWMRTDPRRERVRGRYGTGAGGFSGRQASVPRPPDLHGCYVGPALFREHAAIRMSADESSRAWATITAPDLFIVRDCGDAYVEVVHLLDRWGHFGWVNATELARVGVLQCDDTLLVQNPATRRIFVGTSTNEALIEGDEVMRVGDRAVVGPPFNTVTFWLLTDVCTAWRDGERFVVRTGNEPVREVHSH
jgi:hypothetical protein